MHRRLRVELLGKMEAAVLRIDGGEVLNMLLII